MDPDLHGSGPTPSQALLAFRTIGASLGVGVTLFALVSAFTHQQGDVYQADVDATLMFNLMLALALGGILAAIVFWRARVAPLIERPTPEHRREAGASELQTNVIIVWALVEAPSIFAVLVYFLYENLLAGILGVVMIWTALALTWPRRDWFGR